MHSVYRVVNLLNGKSYIGLTNGTPAKRMRSHIWLANCAKQKSYKTIFSAAIRKYGGDMFRVSTLVECRGRIEAAAQEVRLIALLKPEYNLTAGGEGTVGVLRTAEQRRKMSERRMGTKMSDDTKAKLSAINKAKPRPTGLILERLRQNMAKAKLAVRVPVRCTTDGNIFASGADAARFYGLQKTKITAVCRGRKNHTGGLNFSYAAN